MKAKLVLLVLLVLMAGSFTTAAVALATSDDGKDDRASQGRAPGMGPGTGPGMGPGMGFEKDRGDRPGPPPWAHGRWDRDGKHPWKDGPEDGRNDGWKDAWKDLTPAQRAERMAELAEQHAEGMKKWAACVRDAGEDPQARRACERPWPPGLAKKMQRP